MDGATEKGVSIPTSLVLIVLICTFAVMIYNKTKPMQKTVDTGINTISQSLTSNSFGIYDDTIVSGSSVIGAINTKANSQITVHVTTNASSKDYTTASYNITDVNDTDYIEESANFKATLNKNENGSIIGITFEQQ